MENSPKSTREIHVPVENLANLLYLIRKEANEPARVLEYTTMAEAQMTDLISIVMELYRSIS